MWPTSAELLTLKVHVFPNRRRNPLEPALSTLTKNESKHTSRFIEPTASRQQVLVLWVLRALALLACSVSGYLVWIALSAGEAVGCGGAMDCDAVLQSFWSKWLGLPVSIPALSMYLTLLFALAFAGPLAPDNVRKLAWTLTTALTSLAALAAVWFVFLQMAVVQAFCTWCFTVHVAGLGMFLLAISCGSLAMGRKLLVGSAFGAVGVAALIAGQYFQEDTSGGLVEDNVTNAANTPVVRLDAGQARAEDGSGNEPLPGGISMSDLDIFRIEPGDDEPGDDSNPPITLDPPTVETPDPPSTPPAQIDPEASDEGKQRLLTVLGGTAELNAYQYPIIGSYESDHLVVELFDYTCPHCRSMHRQLAAAKPRFNGRVGFLQIPVPLNTACNPHVTRDSEKHRDACELAALALAVWRSQPAKFEEYHNWLMKDDHPPAVTDARAAAEQLIGTEQLIAQLGDPQLSGRIAVGGQLYKLARFGSIPKLLLPTSVFTGRATTEDELVEMLTRHLGLEGK